MRVILTVNILTCRNYSRKMLIILPHNHDFFEKHRQLLTSNVSVRLLISMLYVSFRARTAARTRRRPRPCTPLRWMTGCAAGLYRSGWCRDASPDTSSRSSRVRLEKHNHIYINLIGVGTGGATGPWPPHFSAKSILKIFPFFLKHNFYRKAIHQDEESTDLRRNP